MRPLESATWLFGAATLGTLALAATSKNAETRSLFYNIAAGAGLGAATMYFLDLAELQRSPAPTPAALRPAGLPVGMPLPPPGLPPPALPPVGPPIGIPPVVTAPKPPPPATPAPTPTPPTPPAPPPPAPKPAGPNSIGCTPLSGILPPSAVAQARGLLALNPTSADERFRPSLLTVSTMRKLANDLRGCGSDLGFQPTRDALVKDLEDTATRFEAALGGPAITSAKATVGAARLPNVLRFA